MQSHQFIVSLLVENHAGVLTRVSSLFSRRAFNIDSLTVGETEEPTLSRMTIVSWGDEYMKDQIVKQLQKLQDVKKVQLMHSDRIVVRELMIVKVKLEKSLLPELMEAVRGYGATVVDLSPDSISMEITGETEKLNAFLDYMRQYTIIEMTRTGPTGHRTEHVLSGERLKAPRLLLEEKARSKTGFPASGSLINHRPRPKAPFERSCHQATSQSRLVTEDCPPRRPRAAPRRAGVEARPYKKNNTT